MVLINHTQPRLLLADEGKHIRDINDVYVPEHEDEETHEIIPEHIPYYATVIFPGIQIQTLEQAEELYVEEVIGEENEESMY